MPHLPQKGRDQGRIGLAMRGDEADFRPGHGIDDRYGLQGLVCKARGQAFRHDGRPQPGLHMGEQGDDRIRFQRRRDIGGDLGEDAIEKKLADSLSTFDDTLLELHADGVEIYSVAYREPAEGPFDRLRGPGSDSSFLPPHAAAPANVPLWAARLLRLAFGAPSRASPTAARFEDPRFTSRYTDVAPLY